LTTASLHLGADIEDVDHDEEYGDDDGQLLHQTTIGLSVLVDAKSETIFHKFEVCASSEQIQN